MADNTILPGVGENFPTDEVSIGGIIVKIPRNKLGHGADGVYDGDVSNANPLPITPRPVVSGGESNHHRIFTNDGNPVSIKATPGQVYRVNIFNIGAVPVYVKFHDTASAPTPGADVVHTVGCQAGVGRERTFPNGLPFAAGIGMTIVTGIADASSAAPVAASGYVEVGYK